MVERWRLMSPTVLMSRLPLVENPLLGSPGVLKTSRLGETTTTELTMSRRQSALGGCGATPVHCKRTWLLALMVADWIRMSPLSASSWTLLLAAVLTISTPGPRTLIFLASTIQVATLGVTVVLMVKTHAVLL